MRYSEEVRRQMLARLTRVSASQLHRETGIAQATLSTWLRAERKALGLTKEDDLKERGLPPQDRPFSEKLRLVAEADQVAEKELGEFLRREGIHEAQLREWRRMMEEAVDEVSRRKAQRRLSPEVKKIRELEREVNRKDKALAEITALLVLQKKLDALWGDGGANTPNPNG